MAQTIERPRTSGPDSGLGGASALARTIPGVNLDRGYEIADRIHHTGLAIVWSGHKEIAELYWEQLRDAGLTMAPLEQG
jgi:ATP-dependent Clp protease adaptor protein ClpS